MTEKNVVQIPKKMIPSKVCFERAGFKLIDISSDSAFYDAELPENWKIVKNDEVWSFIIDEHERRRGTIQSFYSTGNSYALATLNARYKISTTSLNNDNIYEVRLIDYDNSIKYKLISVRCDKNITDNVLTENKYSPEKRLEEDMQKYIETYLPNMSNPNAYWDDRTMSTGKIINDFMKHCKKATYEQKATKCSDTDAAVEENAVDKIINEYTNKSNEVEQNLKDAGSYFDFKDKNKVKCLKK